MSSSVSMSSCPCQLHWTNKVSKAAPQDLHLRAREALLLDVVWGILLASEIRKPSRIWNISNQWTLAGTDCCIWQPSRRMEKHARSVCRAILPVLFWHTSPLTWMWVNPGSSGTLWYHNCHLVLYNYWIRHRACCVHKDDAFGHTYCRLAPPQACSRIFKRYCIFGHRPESKPSL